MKYKYLIINFLVFSIISFSILYFLENDNDDSKISPYWFILAVSLPIILRFLFPKLKELGVGTSYFFPNLYDYFKEKLKK